MIGFVIGAATGVVQFRMLSRFTYSVTHGAITVKAVLFGVSQFFLPLAVLLSCALLIPRGLLWSGVGMSAALIVSAAVWYILAVKRRGK